MKNERLLLLFVKRFLECGKFLFFPNQPVPGSIQKSATVSEQLDKGSDDRKEADFDTFILNRRIRKDQQTEKSERQ